MAHRLIQLGTILLVIVAAVIFFTPPPAGMSAVTMRAGALVTLVIGLWALGSLPEHVTGMIFFLLAMVLAIAPANVVFSGFASATIWLVLGGLIIAEAVNRTGLGERFARFLLRRFTLSYPALIAAVVIVSTGLAFLMPATVGRVLLLLPILSAVAEHLGLARGSRGHNGVCLAAIISTYQCGTAILPANAPNLVLAGASETLYGVPLIYAEYLLVQFPVMGILKAALIALLVCMLFPARTATQAEALEARPMSAEERRLTVILVASLALWATDFLHGVQPGWVALGAGLAAMLPRIGVMPVAVFNERVRFGVFFYIAAVLGMGATMSATGLSEALGAVVQGALDLKPQQDGLNFLVLSLLATFTAVLVTNPGQPALLAPLAGQFAEAAGWPLKAALMTMAVGFTTLLLPYQVPPVVVGLQVAGIKLRTALRLTVPLAAVSFVTLLPLDYLWWRLIGYFG